MIAERRWHLDCFRCNQCHTLLDSDANLLLLGDGSLICNNCTYSCSACGNKIEDLAILTGDQAFCAACFRCRNCKRKIENLRYARTSQGIFCMSCHESLMARRRKKSKAAAAQAKAKEKEAQIEKSLPALPPNEIALQSTFSPERSTFESDRSTLSPPPRIQQPSTNDSSRSSSRRAASSDRSGDNEGLTLPNTTYRNNRHSVISQESDLNGLGGEDGFYIPLALDPCPAPQFAPRSTSQNVRGADLVKTKENSKDYFNSTRGSARNQGTATPSSQVSTPHIAFQANGRTLSSEHVPGTESPRRPAPSGGSAPTHASPAHGSDEPKRHLAEAMKSAYANDRGQSSSDQFRLQQVPVRKKSNDSRSGSSQENEIESDKSRHIAGSHTPAQPPRRDISSNFPRTDSAESGLHKRDGSYLSLDKIGTPRSSAESRFRNDSDSTPGSENAPTFSMREAPPRNESSKSIPRKEVGGSGHKPSASLAKLEALTSSKPASDAAPTVNGKEISPPLLGSQSLLRPAPPQQKLSDTYMAPREPPAPPAPRRSAKESGGSSAGEVPSTELPRWSAGGDFTMDEDMARILGADEGSQSILRRVSNAVRHGRAGSEASTGGRHGHVRSISETTARQIGSPRFPQTPIVEDGHQSGHTRQISSPISMSGRADDPAFLRRQLRDSEQRVAELEKQFTTTKDLSKINKQLVEKRKTVSELGSQAELMIRQIEAFAGYVEKARNNKGEFDLQDMEDSAIKEFVQKVERLKDSLNRELEVLFVEREQLLEEKDQAIKARDRALIEFEQLSSKNAQLADMNNDLTTQIQERFKAQSGANDMPKTNGLGIYHSKDKSSVHLDDASMNSATTIYGSNGHAVGTYPQPMDVEGDSQVFAAPQVVQIRKLPGKKFNWGKKGATVAKGVTKGFKGAFYSEKDKNQQQQWQEQPAGDNIGMPYNMTRAAVESPQQMPPSLPPRHASNDPGRFGLFKKSHNGSKNQSLGDLSLLAGPGPQTLFGSDLTERADFEGSQIPRVVIKCIQEVEIRGMDVEGIYRKTGGSGLTKQLQEGFEKSEDYDISDPDIDITAITSALKQYFRKLPTPLLTFDVYDRVLGAMCMFFLPSHSIIALLKFRSHRGRARALPPPPRNLLLPPTRPPRHSRVPHVPPVSHPRSQKGESDECEEYCRRVCADDYERPGY